MTKYRTLLTTLVISFIALPAFPQGAPIVGSSGVTLSIGSSVVEGDQTTGTLRVNLSGVTGQGASGSTAAVLGGYQISVSFDKTKLQFVSASGGTSPGFNGTPTYTDPTSANAAGVVSLTASQTNSSSPTGNVTVARLTFKALSQGDASIQVSPSSLSSAYQPPSYGPTSISGTGSSTVVNVTPPPSPPAIFNNSSPANGAMDVGRPVTLRWEASTGATTYTVYFGDSASPKAVGSTKTTTYSVDTTTGFTYYWRVVASNGVGSYEGPLWHFETEGPYCPIPGTTSLTAPSSVGSGISYELNWESVSGADEYKVEEATSPSFVGSSVTTVASPAHAATFSHTATNPTPYYYRVTARNTAGGCDVAGSASATKTVTVDPAIVLPEPEPEPSTVNVVPVVGSLPGGFGSYFRTTLQLHNATDTQQTGVLVYRPREGGEASLSYALAPHQTITYYDILEELDLTGIGSLDVIPTAGGFPVAISRIFNDAGAAGTSGMTMEQVDPVDALKEGDTGIIVGPSDLSMARLNLGIRTMDDPVTVQFKIRSAGGAITASGTLAFGPNVFQQQTATEFLGYEIPASAVIEFTVDTGRAILYGTVTDTATNDPSYQKARKIQ